VFIALAFVLPDRRSRDLDNLLARMKSGLDGLADAMGVDDRHWRLAIEIAPEVVKGGAVLVTVEVSQ
jgi:crossover junction endodeoxyribonuclease RusA